MMNKSFVVSLHSADQIFCVTILIVLNIATSTGSCPKKVYIRIRRRFRGIFMTTWRCINLVDSKIRLNPYLDLGSRSELRVALIGSSND